MRMVLVLAMTVLGSSVAAATPRATVPLSNLLDVSRVKLTPARQVLLLPDAASPSSLQAVELRVVKPATTLLKGERRCRPRAAK